MLRHLPETIVTDHISDHLKKWNPNAQTHEKFKTIQTKLAYVQTFPISFASQSK